MRSTVRGGISALLILSLALHALPALGGETPANASASAGTQAADAQAKPVRPPIDTSGIQSQALLAAIGKILKRASEERQSAKNLPERDQFLFPPLWTETREDRESSVRQLLDSALDIVTDAPILKLQEEIAKQREKIAAGRDKIARLREKRLDAPESGLMPGILTDTQSSINKTIEALEDDIKVREADIARIKQDIGNALTAAGIELSKEKLDLLLDSVLGSHLLKLVTAFEVSKIADQKLATLLNQSKDDLKAARRYFAMHAALFAMLVEAQGLLIEQIDTIYLVRLDKIAADVARTNAETRQLLQSQARDDQRRVLEANLKAQEESQKVSAFYKEYLRNQRRHLAEFEKPDRVRPARRGQHLRDRRGEFSTQGADGRRQALLRCLAPAGDAGLRANFPE